VEVLIVDLGQNFTILNIYGPYQDRVPYWESLVPRYFFLRDNVIIGGDLNFSLGEIEVWGPRAHADSHTDLF
jgi:hypothetical protein